jgi:hypothetical protein
MFYSAVKLAMALQNYYALSQLCATLVDVLIKNRLPYQSFSHVISTSTAAKCRLAGSECGFAEGGRDFFPKVEVKIEPAVIIYTFHWGLVPLRLAALCYPYIQREGLKNTETPVRKADNAAEIRLCTSRIQVQCWIYRLFAPYCTNPLRSATP